MPCWWPVAGVIFSFSAPDLCAACADTYGPRKGLAYSNTSSLSKAVATGGLERTSTDRTIER